MKKRLLGATTVLIILLAGCDLQPDPLNGISADGILIYSGNEILNNTTWEIVTGRVQQLRAISLSGHQIVWNCNNLLAMEVTQTGLVRVGPSPNKEAVITAASAQDPSVYAQVTFKTKGLR